ncbi:MAG: hypothetical protein H6R10_1331 [Rhodocyclaceae bacterium]|nr:hypothetical protein [Rhodocyclaceae bacterium]
MKRLLDHIKQSLEAMAIADLGERSGRRAMHKSLFPGGIGGQETAAPPGGPQISDPAAQGSRWIALGVGAALPELVLAYAAGACRRMSANLLFIAADDGPVIDAMAKYYGHLDGLLCDREIVEGGARGSALAALAGRPGIAFAISGTADDPLRPLSRRRGMLEARVPVPIVLIGKEARKPRVSESAPRIVKAT